MASKPFSISFGSKAAKPQVATAKNPKKRPHSALAEPESDHEETNQPQLVSGFDQSTGGAVHVSEPSQKEVLVIKAQKNRNWREESRRKRGKNLLPAEVQAARNGALGASTNATIERDEISTDAGLKFVRQPADEDTPMTNGDGTPPTASLNGGGKPPTADEEALNALLGKEKQSTLAIPVADLGQKDDVNGNDESDSEPANEDSRFRADVASRPDSCTLADYARIPVEEFGAAMLRGMQQGRTGDTTNEKSRAPKVVERRPALLGIGAKEVPGDIGQELGAWGKAAKGKKKVDMTYNPILLKNSKTGEMLTEEELEKKKIEASKHKNEDDWRDRRDRNVATDRDRKKDRLAIEASQNGDHKRRNRSRSRDRDRRGYDDTSGHRRRDRSRERSPPSRRNRSRSLNGDRHPSRRERSRSKERRRKEDRGEHAKRYRRHEHRERDYRR